MKYVVALAGLLLLSGCATQGGLVPGQATRADVEAAMGPALEESRRPEGETWLYYPSQPYGRKVRVARLAPDGRLIALEQRLNAEYIARLVPGQSTREDVRALFGPPYEALTFARLERETWTWHMKQFTGLPAVLHVQMSADGVVREVYVLDEYDKGGSRGR